MQYLIRQIKRSIQFNEIVTIKAACPMQYVDFIDATLPLCDKCDNARENDGSRDVWGTFHKESFRLKIIQSNPIQSNPIIQSNSIQ